MGGPWRPFWVAPKGERILLLGGVFGVQNESELYMHGCIRTFLYTYADFRQYIAGPSVLRCVCCFLFRGREGTATVEPRAFQGDRRLPNFFGRKAGCRAAGLPASPGGHKEILVSRPLSPSKRKPLRAFGLDRLRYDGWSAQTVITTYQQTHGWNLHWLLASVQVFLVFWVVLIFGGGPQNPKLFATIPRFAKEAC